MNIFLNYTKKKGLPLWSISLNDCCPKSLKSMIRQNSDKLDDLMHSTLLFGQDCHKLGLKGKQVTADCHCDPKRFPLQCFRSHWTALFSLPRISKNWIQTKLKWLIALYFFSDAQWLHLAYFCLTYQNRTERFPCNRSGVLHDIQVDAHISTSTLLYCERERERNIFSSQADKYTYYIIDIDHRQDLMVLLWSLNDRLPATPCDLGVFLSCFLAAILPFSFSFSFYTFLFFLS